MKKVMMFIAVVCMMFQFVACGGVDGVYENVKNKSDSLEFKSGKVNVFGASKSYEVKNNAVYITRNGVSQELAKVVDSETLTIGRATYKKKK